jgi:ABC-2 type transport system permease protein
MASRITVQVGACLTMAAVILVTASQVNRIILSPAGYALTMAVTIIGAAMFLSIGQALVGLIKSAETVNALGRFVFIGLIIFGLVGESGKLGASMQTAATWSPYGVINNLLSGVMSTSWSGATSLAALVSVGYIIVFAGIGIKWFRWDANP